MLVTSLVPGYVCLPVKNSVVNEAKFNVTGNNKIARLLHSTSLTAAKFCHPTRVSEQFLKGCVQNVLSIARLHCH